MLTSIDIPEALLQKIDAVVGARRKAKHQPHACTPAQLAEAQRVAKENGMPAANAFLKSIRPVVKASRSGVILDLLRECETRLDEMAKPQEDPSQKRSRSKAAQSTLRK